MYLSRSRVPLGRLYSALSGSTMFRDFKQAFEKATGLPLTIHLPAGEPECGSAEKSAGTTPFCARMAGAHHACTTYCAFQERLEEEAALQPKTLKCLAGMCETAVPVRVGGKLIAFLQTGGVLLATPNRRFFSGVAREFLRLGTPVELKRFEKDYYVSRVLAPEQYDSMVRLVTIFAGHLAACGEQFASQQMAPETPTISRARQIIAAGFREELSLGSVAQQVNMSAEYFGELFKKSTGLNFVEYVARLRVGEAHTRLLIPKSRVSEVAFEVGFQSLSQFNRSFHRIAGMSPRTCQAA
ncbi:MAG: helix-turn-helix domain-containing protein [Opitutaceae bacterium]